MKQRIFKIKENIALNQSIMKMTLAGDTSGIKCGQFVNLKISGLYLRRPISVCDCENGELTLIYKIVGKGTEMMSKMQDEEIDI